MQRGWISRCRRLARIAPFAGWALRRPVQLCSIVLAVTLLLGLDAHTNAARAQTCPSVAGSWYSSGNDLTQSITQTGCTYTGTAPYHTKTGAFSGTPNLFNIVVARTDPSTGCVVNFYGTDEYLSNGQLVGTIYYTSGTCGFETGWTETQVYSRVSSGLASQTIYTWDLLPASAIAGNQTQLRASSNSGLAVTFSTTTPSVCTVVDGAVWGNNVGTCTVRASQAGTTGWAAAADLTQSVTYLAAPTSTVLGSSSSSIVAGQSVTLTATASCPDHPLSIPTQGTATFMDGATVLGTTSLMAGVATLTTSALAVGTHSLTATFNGTANFNASTSAAISVAVTAPTVTVTTSSLPTVAYANAYAPPALTATGGSAPYTFAATGLPTGLALDAQTGAISGKPLQVGTFTVSVTATDGSAAAIGGPFVSAAKAVSLLVDRTGQTLSFTSAAPAGAMVGATYSPTAFADSGLTPVVTVGGVSSSVCSISSGVVSFLAPGTCVLDANQPGNTNYLSGAQVQQSFSVGRGTQTISFTAPANTALTSGPVAISATASSGLAVSFASATAAVCTVSGNTVTLIAVGTCSITASQAGNANYFAAADVARSFAVTTTSQAIVFTSGSPTSAVVGGTYTPTATASSGLAVAITIDGASTSVCSISSGKVTFNAAGTCTINADQAGNASYSAAAQVQQVIAVGLPLTINATSLPAATAGTLYSSPALSITGGTAPILLWPVACRPACR